MRTREDSPSPPARVVSATTSQGSSLQLPQSVALQVSTAPEHSPRAPAKDIEGRIVWLHVVQHVGEVKIYRPADSTAAETRCNGRSKLKPCICSGSGRR